MAGAVLLLAGCREERESVLYDLLAGAELAAVAHERTVLDVGTPAARPFLDGFSWAERDADGRTFAWSAGDVSAVSFALHSIEPRSLVLRGSPYAGDPETTARTMLSLTLNGTPLGTIELSSAQDVHAIEVAVDAQRLGANTLAIQYPRTYRGRGGAGSRRAIAVAWDAIAMLPARAGVPLAQRLDDALAGAALASAADPLDDSGCAGAGVCLAASTATSWSLDLGPGAELRLDRGDPRASSAAGGLAVWIEAPDGGPKLLAEVEPGRRHVRLPLGLEELATVRLTLIARSRAELDRSAGAHRGVALREAQVVYPLSSLSAARGGSRPGAPRAHGVPAG